MRSWGELELQPYALGLCGRVLLHAGGAIFSRKPTLIKFTGLLNKTSRVTVGVRLRESYDFAHLISKERYAAKIEMRISCQPEGASFIPFSMSRGSTGMVGL